MATIMNTRTNNNNNNSNNSHDEDENDNGEWSDNCLYRRMLRGSQRIQMMKRQNGSGSGSLSLLQQALQKAEVEPSILVGIKVLRINIFKEKTFDMRYFTMDKTREYICLTPEPLPPNVLAQGKCHRHFPPLPKKVFASSAAASSAAASNHKEYQFLDVADIDAWHVGTVATRRAEVARRLETTRAKGGSSFDEVATEKLLTIYFKGSETLDLVVPVTQHMNMIVSSLSEIHAAFHRAQPWISKESSLLRYIANQIEMESNDTITQVQFHKICEILHVGQNEDAAFCFQSRTNKNVLPFSECLGMLRSLKPKQTQAMVLWDFLFGGNGQSSTTSSTISHKDLHRQFLSQIQSEPHLSTRQAQALWTFIQTIEISHPLVVVADNDGDERRHPQDNGDTAVARNNKALQQEQFEEFLYSDLNDAYDPEIQQREPRLDQPLSAYWINTSFKTFRTKTQETTCASVEGYMKALIRGCKCLDLDCWDGPSMPNASICIPMVGHPNHTNKKGGGTNNNLLLRHVCDVVEAYLKMHPTSYPIILSIENYCTVPFQEAASLIFQEILGHRLVLPQNNGLSYNNNNAWDERLPSPESLRGRIILHSKAHPELNNNDQNNKDWFFKRRLGGVGTATTIATTQPSKPQPQSWKGYLMGMIKTENSMEEIVGTLRQLVFLEGGKLTGNLENMSQQQQNKNHTILSVAGSKQKEMLQSGIIQEQDHRLHHASHLTRTHPTSLIDDKRRTRTSNNKNPIPVQAWSLGCQAVALRLECGDNAVLLNDGLFRQQNGIGYVLKPPFILGLQPANPISLFVRVLGGRCLPSPMSSSSSSTSRGDQTHLAVSVTLYDVQTKKNDNKEEVYKDCHMTNSVDGSGFAPVWKDRGKKFGIQQPDIAMVLFQVMMMGGRRNWNSGNNRSAAATTCVASAAIPVSCLRKGYRSIQFFDDNNCRTGALRYASLLVHIEY